MRRAFLRLILVGLLLVAQQAAVTHAIWHAHDNLPGHAQSGSQNGERGYQHGDDEHSSQAALCGFDAVFGQVLGGAHGSTSHVCTSDIASHQSARSARTYASAPALSFYSRGPPVLL